MLVMTSCHIVLAGVVTARHHFVDGIQQLIFGLGHDDLGRELDFAMFRQFHMLQWMKDPVFKDGVNCVHAV